MHDRMLMLEKLRELPKEFIIRFISITTSEYKGLKKIQIVLPDL